ncbi:hypothetical protein BDW74DRAFT_179145 [Aspergillus multicolor]|uniref:uncharacterized protein n=1 Tax=Aspergillus multicolor TaxID=41759 RepID=UPI003CCD5309
MSNPTCTTPLSPRMVDIYVSSHCDPYLWDPIQIGHHPWQLTLALVPSGTTGHNGGRTFLVTDTINMPGQRRGYDTYTRETVTPQTLATIALLGTYPAAPDDSLSIAAEHIQDVMRALRRQGYLDGMPTSDKIKELCRDLADRVKRAKERGVRVGKRVARAGSDVVVEGWCVVKRCVMGNGGHDRFEVLAAILYGYLGLIEIFGEVDI